MNFDVPWYVALTIGAIFYLIFFIGAPLVDKWWAWIFAVLSVAWIIFWFWKTFIEERVRRLRD